MADYIYLLENRLSAAQRAAVLAMRALASEKGLTLFLAGGAVRDLTSGSPVRDLDFLVQGNALKLRKDLEKTGTQITGEQDALQALYLLMPGGVRAELGSTLSATWPKPAKPVFKPATLQDDLRRRDFTANAMALSLNDGSYGLLIDPLNGVADIENRELRLVSNYGFIEEPVRMVRAARLMARLGWTLEEKTRNRYETGRQEGYISGLSSFHRGYELEEMVHEEDPLRVLKRLEDDGWMKHLAPFWITAKANAPELEKLREAQSRLQVEGISAEGGAAAFPLLTAKLAPKEIASLKSSFPRAGFVAEIDGLDEEAKEFSGLLSGKTAAAPSQAWKLITSTRPEAVLQSAYGSRSAVVQARFRSFHTEWPQARQRIPYALMQEMRIHPELAGYAELVEKLFFELMDGKLSTPEEMKAYLEPYSPPAPPPPVNLRRAKAVKKESKPARSRVKKAKQEDDDFDETSDEAATPNAAPATPPAPVTSVPDAAPEKAPAKPTVPAAAKSAVPAEEKAAPSSILPVASKPEVKPKPVPAKAVAAKPAVAQKPEVKKPEPARKTAQKTSAGPAKRGSVKVVPPVKAAAPVKAAVSAKPASAGKQKTAPARPTKPAAKTKAAPVKQPVKKAAARASTPPAKKSVARPSAKQGKKLSTKKTAPLKKTAPAKKVAPAKKPAPAKKTIPAKKSVPAKKTAAKVVAKKAVPLKKVGGKAALKKTAKRR